MPLNLKATYKFKNLSLPVSYKTNNDKFLLDAQNVYTNQDRLDTRFGVQRFTTYALNGLGFILDVSLLDVNYTDEGTVADETVLEDVDSMIFFKKTDGSTYYIAKAGTVLWSASLTGQHTVLLTGLDSTNKIRGVTFNDRCFIAIGSDGLYSFDGSTITQLGQDAPTTALTVAKSGSGTTLTGSTYQVAYTYYSSSTGFETNLGTASAEISPSTGEQIDVTNISTTAPSNELIDKKRIYFKDVTNDGNWLFWSEISLATSSETIDTDATSADTPPTKNAAPLSGGGKFIDVFGSKIVYSGSTTYPNDVFFSESYIPDAFNDTASRIIFTASGDGQVTGLKSGYYNDTNLTPFVCVFKKRSIEIYSEIGDVPSIVKINNIGSISPDSIKEINGNVYFMSETGFFIVSNGKLVSSSGNPASLSNGEIDSIFTDVGSPYELNQSISDRFFSIYLSSLKQYMTFIAESGSYLINKAYNFEFDIGGFRPYLFPVYLVSGMNGENSSGEDCAILGCKNGRLYYHGKMLTKTDYDIDNTATNIDAFVQLPWITHDEFDATLNFGEMILKGIQSSTAITTKIFLNYNLSQYYDSSYSFNSAGGFILDESILDVDFLGDNRTIVRDLNGGIYKTAQSLSVQFNQSGQNLNMGLLSLQLSSNKNGNPN